MIDYMKDKEYNEDEDIKLFIITNKNIPIIATKSSDGINMNKVYNLNYYEKSYECKYHIDYLQVLLNKCFKNTQLNNYIGITDNQKAEEIIKEIVNRNNVVL